MGSKRYGFLDICNAGIMGQNWRAICGRRYWELSGCVHKGTNHVPKDVSDRDPLRDWDRDLNYVRSHALQGNILFLLRSPRWLTHAYDRCMASCSAHSPPPPPGGGGGTSVLKVTGTCRWTGYDFAVINISTGYLVALLRSSILAQGILWPSCGHQYWHRVYKSA